jgi:hypothetical protein
LGCSSIGLSPKFNTPQFNTPPFPNAIPEVFQRNFDSLEHQIEYWKNGGKAPLPIHLPRPQSGVQGRKRDADEVLSVIRPKAIHDGGKSGKTKVASMKRSGESIADLHSI